MKYERLTDRKIAEMLINTEGDSWDSDNIEAQCYIRLAELEDKIESGELISTTQEDASDQEVAFFAEHNDGVRKLFADDLKDRLQADLAHGDITQEAYEVIEGEINYCLDEVEE